ncbi:hypothetical protein UlMin_040465 [Ulmus minor]
MTIRRTGEEECHYDENEEEAFTLRVHHHGRFNEAKNEYIGGEVTYFDWVCIDFLSLLNLDVIAKDLGYRLPLSYYWKEYGENVEYEQEVEDAAMEDCVDPTSYWEQSFEIPEMASEDRDGSESDMHLSEGELNSVDGSEEERRHTPWVRKTYPEFNAKTDLKDPKFQVGQVFASADLFRKAVRAHALKQRRAVVFEKNDPNRIRVGCKSENCGWQIFASILSEDRRTFKVKTYTPLHTCAMVFKNGFVNSNMLGRKYVNQWRVNPDWNFAGFAQQLRDDYSVDASLWQYYRARKHAKKLIEGTVKEQYARIWDYCAELRRMNPGSTTQVKCSLDGDIPVFQRIYICLAALRKGWLEGCRRIIGLDGCFIKGQHRGQLLTAVGVDPNNQMYPIAYAVVETENRKTWQWFLELLKVDLNINNSHGIAWITDKQKGLIDAIADLFPNSEHRFCVKHLHNNFKVYHKGLLLKQTLWGAATAATEQRFAQKMAYMREVSASAYEWMTDKDPRHWSRAFFKEFPKCDMLCNNYCEGFNSAILEARDKPIITLLEMIRNYLMKRMAKKRVEVDKWHHLVGPKVFKFIEKVKLETSGCHSDFCGNNIFQVRNFEQDQFVVDIQNRTCACRRWQLVGIPCVHAMCVIMTSNMDPIQFVDDCYKKDRYKLAYDPVIYGLNGPSMWPQTGDTPIRCPEFKKQRGRPRKARKLQSDEVRQDGTTRLRKNYVLIHCRRCGQVGHNKKRGRQQKKTPK